jgi:[acyl-carrier-protein] S-malonyltransferase
MALAQEAGARKVVPLAVSIAAHSPLMAGAQVEFNLAVQAAPIQNPLVPLVGNVTAAALRQADQIRADLQAQLTHRVRWTESVHLMVAQGVDTFIEIGSGSVLIGLLKRIDRSVNGLALGKPEDYLKLEVEV